MSKIPSILPNITLRNSNMRNTMQQLNNSQQTTSITHNLLYHRFKKLKTFKKLLSTILALITNHFHRSQKPPKFYNHIISDRIQLQVISIRVIIMVIQSKKPIYIHSQEDLSDTLSQSHNHSIWITLSKCIQTKVQNNKEKRKEIMRKIQLHNSNNK